MLDFRNRFNFRTFLYQRLVVMDFLFHIQQITEREKTKNNISFDSASHTRDFDHVSVYNFSFLNVLER